MNIRFDFKKVQIIARRLVTLLAILFLCAPISLLNADSTTEPQTTLHKTITPISGQDDKYELSLDITSKLGTETQTDPLDVVLVADLSGSMTYQDVNSSNGALISRLQALKNTLQGENGRRGLIDTILSNSNNRLSIVGFAGKIDNQRYNSYYQWPAWAGYFSGISSHDDAKTVLNWSNDVQGAKRMVSRMSVDNSGDSIGYEGGIGTGTNIGAGLQSATELLQSARSSAKKVVILLSDGFANMYYDTRGYTIYNWSNNDGVTEIAPSWYQTNLNTFTETVSGYLAPKIDGFYSIKFRYSNSTDSISKLKEYIGSYNSSIPNEILSANNERELREQFKEITKKILPLAVHHVTIKDVLSKYVQLLPDNSSNIRVVKIENDKEETLGSDKVTLETRKNENGLVEVTAKFNPNYILDDGVKYALKFTVTSSQDALDAIAGDKKLEAGDAEGSDVNKLYSNKGASVTYSYGIGTSQTKTKEYSDNPTFKPSDPLTVPVEVEWQGVTGARTVITANIRDAQNSPLNGTYNATVNNKRIPLQFTNGRASIDLNKDQTIKIDGLPLNSHYTIEEESNSSRGYQVSYENQEGKLDGDKSATVTNNKNSVPETGVDFLSSTLVLGIILPLGGIFFTILLGYLVVHRRK